MFLTIFAFASILPSVWVAISAFKPNTEIIKYPPALFPSQWTISHYFGVFGVINLMQSFQNSFFMTLICTISVVLTSCLAGYALSILNVRGKSVIITLVMLGIVMPMQTTYIPLFTMVSQFNMMNTFPVLILPFLTSAFGVFLISQVFLGIPSELVDAATVDGLGHMKILFSIVIPLSKSSIMTLIIFTSMGVWREFYWPFLVVTKEAFRTVPIALAYFLKSESVSINWGYNLAMCTLASLPLITIYLICQQNLVEGIAWSGLKQ